MSLKNLPKVDKVLRDTALGEYRCNITPSSLALMVGEEVDKLRKSLLSGECASAECGELHERVVYAVCRRLEKRREGRLRRVINATGVVTHTNLGRALLSDSAARRVVEAATCYTNLEYSIETAGRRSRLSYVNEMLCDLTGAEDALVVNNNAAAVFLVFNTLASGSRRGVIVSRGEIVEIGDGFRISEIIANSGAKLVEVGATNRTTARDYAQAIDEGTAALARIHTSNYKIVGYTKAPTTGELADIAAAAGLPMIEDMGSGNLVELSRYGLPHEPTPRECIMQGADVVTFSGDKLLGGPQAGIIVGKRRYVEALRKNQLMRCLRIDKLCLAALEATLESYISGDAISIPTLARILRTTDTEAHANALLQACSAAGAGGGLKMNVGPHAARFGGGAMPMVDIPSHALYIEGSSAALEAHLRAQPTPIIATIIQDTLVLDVLTMEDADFQHVANALKSHCVIGITTKDTR